MNPTDPVIPDAADSDDPASAIDEVPPKPSPDDPAAVAVRVALAAGLRGLLVHEVAARHGDAEGVHQMRKATRRLRAELRAFRPLIEEAWGQPLIEDLRTLGHALGAARDLDVLRCGLLESAGALAADLGPLLACLDERQTSARRALTEMLASDFLWRLVRQLAEGVRRPPVTAEASAPCRRALPPLVRQAWKRLKARGRLLGPGDPDAAYHEVRVRAKRLRHASEAAAGALAGDSAKNARRLARRAAALVELLGTHQDAVVARDWIRQTVAGLLPDAQLLFASGRLAERQEQAIRDARTRVPQVWDRIDRKVLRRWMND